MRCARRRTAAAAALVGLLALPGTATAGDLVALDGDPPVVLRGAVAFGTVYVNTTLRLSGDTQITADRVYIGPNALLRTCSDGGVNDNACTTGRSLTIVSGGPVTIDADVRLNAGGSTGPRAGGTLSITGSRVALGGVIDTTGYEAGSGNVGIASTGPVAIDGDIAAPGASTVIHGGSISIGGDLQASSNGNIAPVGKEPPAGRVELFAATGDLVVDGVVDVRGRYAGVPSTAGGDGGPADLRGSRVRVGGISTNGGGADDGPGGVSAPIAVHAAADIAVAGPVDAAGARAVSGGDGSSITLAAGGGVVTGVISAAGASASQRGGNGGPIAISGATISTGALEANGGQVYDAVGRGGSGAAVTVAGTGVVAVGAISAQGSPGYASGSSGGGAGSIDVHGATVSTGRAFASGAGGGYNGSSPGMPGGSIRIVALDGLVIGGRVDASASAATGNVTPPQGGAGGGPVLLSGGSGPLAVTGTVNTTGGGGAGTPDAAPGGAGGAGGPVDLVGGTIDSLGGVLTGGGRGGDYGDGEGPGGAGGSIRSYSSTDPFTGSVFVDSAGGEGHLRGLDGEQTRNLPPTGLVVGSDGRLSFAGRSPSGTGFRILRSLGGGPFTALTTTTTTANTVADPGLCVLAAYAVEAFAETVGWTSQPTPAVATIRPPSKSQTCTQAARLTGAHTIAVRRGLLRHRRWRLVLRVRSTGTGTVTAAIYRGARRLRRGPARAVAAGRVSLALTLPLAARRAGRYRIVLTTMAPTGAATTRWIVRLRVRA